MLKIKSIYEKAASAEEAFVYMEKADFLSPDPHFHNRFEIIFIISGSADLVCNNKEYHGSQNCIFFINKFDSHVYKNISDDLQAYVISANDYYLKDFNVQNKHKVFPNLLDNVGCNRQVKRYFDSWFEKGHEDILYNAGWFNVILGTLVENYSLIEIDENELRKSLIRGIADFIQDHYSENLTLKTVADKTGYSAAYFSVIFKDAMGESFRSYLNGVRMREAQRLLQTTNETNENIAAETGYNSMSSFYRAKRKFKLKK